MINLTHEERELILRSLYYTKREYRNNTIFPESVTQGMIDFVNQIIEKLKFGEDDKND